jgi:hypothetical protein
MPARPDETSNLPVALNVATGLLISRALFHLGRRLWPKARVIDDALADFD